MTSLFGENIYILLIIIPILYIAGRDIVGIFNRKKEKKENEKRIRESEIRISELMKKLDVNREDLLKQLSTIQQKINSDENLDPSQENEKKET